MKQFFFNHVDYIVAVLLGGVGGIIRTVAALKREERWKPFVALPEIMIAMFAGFLVNSLLCKWNADVDTRVIVISVAGFTARETLEMLRAFGTGVVRVMLQRNNNGDDK